MVFKLVVKVGEDTVCVKWCEGGGLLGVEGLFDLMF